MKKLIIAIVTVIMSLLLICMTACNNEHSHTFASDWTSDENTHWHKATCGHDDQKGNEAAHSFVNGKCSICGYPEKQSGSPNKDNIETDGHDFKISVLGPDGKPYTSCSIQVCIGNFCDSNFLPVDSNGVCYIDREAEEIHINVMGLPVNLTYDDCNVKYGHAAVIQLKESYPDYEGTGVGEFDGDAIKKDGFNPFKMVYISQIGFNENIYKVTVVNKTMYIEFTGEEDIAAKYNIKVEGASGKITILSSEGESIKKTDKTAEGEDPTVDFDVTMEKSEGDDKEVIKKVYIEIALTDEAVGKDILIHFAYLEDLE